MADDCIFCRITRGEIPATVVYEDAHAIAFLDIAPLTLGHTLLVPKVHRSRLEDCRGDELADSLRALPALVDAVTRAVGADGATVAWNNGRAAGQEVDHLHLHIVPRTAGDAAGPVHGMFADRPTMADGELAGIAARVQAEIKSS